MTTMKEEKANVESDLLNQNRNRTKNFAISPNSAISHNYCQKSSCNYTWQKSGPGMNSIM